MAILIDGCRQDNENIHTIPIFVGMYTKAASSVREKSQKTSGKTKETAEVSSSLFRLMHFSKIQKYNRPVRDRSFIIHPFITQPLGGKVDTDGNNKREKKPWNMT